MFDIPGESARASMLVISAKSLLANRYDACVLLGSYILLHHQISMVFLKWWMLIVEICTMCAMLEAKINEYTAQNSRSGFCHKHDIYVLTWLHLKPIVFLAVSTQNWRKIKIML